MLYNIVKIKESIKGEKKMLNEKTVTVKMKRIDLCKLMAACTHIKFDFVNDASNAKTEVAKGIAERSAKMWTSLHDMLKKQLEDFDENHKDEI